MKPLLTKWPVLAVALLMLSSCGGGSTGGNGSASTMTVTVATGTGMSGGTGTITYTEGPINHLGYYDPSFSGDCFPTPSTLITMCSGVTKTTCDILVNVRTAGTTTGPYLITGGSTTSTTTYILYNDHGNYYDSLVSTGTVTLATVGKVGEPITGSFQAILALRTIGTPTMGISGTFSVIRDH